MSNTPNKDRKEYTFYDHVQRETRPSLEAWEKIKAELASEQQAIASLREQVKQLEGENKKLKEESKPDIVLSADPCRGKHNWIPSYGETRFCASCGLLY